MGEGLFALLAFSVSIGVASLLAYNENGKKMITFAGGVLFFLLLISQISSLVSEFESFNINEYMEQVKTDFELDGEYERVAEDAFREGISRLLYEDYGIDKNDAKITVQGFSFKTMSATRVKILLLGKAIYKDALRIEESLNTLGIGKFYVEVNINFG